MAKLRRRKDPLRKAVRILTLKIRQRSYAKEYEEKEINENLDLIRRRCKEFKIEVLSMLARLDIAVKESPNSCLWQLIDWHILKLKDHPDWWASSLYGGALSVSGYVVKRKLRRRKKK